MYEVGEDDGFVEVCIIMGPAIDEDTVIILSTVNNGNAIGLSIILSVLVCILIFIFHISPLYVEGIDYIPQNTSLVFEAGATRNCTTITILSDGRIHDGARTFDVQITAMAPCVVQGGPSTVTIIDADGK